MVSELVPSSLVSQPISLGPVDFPPPAELRVGRWAWAPRPLPVLGRPSLFKQKGGRCQGSGDVGPLPRPAAAKLQSVLSALRTSCQHAASRPRVPVPRLGACSHSHLSVRLSSLGKQKDFMIPMPSGSRGGGPLRNPHSDWICNQAALAQKLLPMKEEILTQPLSAPRPQGLWRSWRGREEPWGPVILGRQHPQNTPQGHAGDARLQQPEPHRPATCLPPTLPNHFFD